MRGTRRATLRIVLAVLAGAVSLVSFTLVAAAPGGASSPTMAIAQAGTGGGIARTGRIGAGRMVDAATSTRPFRPTRVQQAARDRAMAIKATLKPAPLGSHTTRADVHTKNPGPPTVPSNGRPRDFKIFQDSVLPCCRQASILEPSTANSGKTFLVTSNFNLGYSEDGGTTWTYQDLYGLFGPDLCCDQAVMYEPSRDRYIYEGLDFGGYGDPNNAVAIGVAGGSTATQWCVYHFYPDALGGEIGELLDFPHIAYSNNAAYLTWNLFGTNGYWKETGLARFPLDRLAACLDFSYDYFTRTDNFTFGLTQGGSSLDQLYWVADWYTGGGGSGKFIRIFRWPEERRTYQFVDKAINPYHFSGGSCASEDGVVTDWCTRLDPRWMTAWISHAEYRGRADHAFAGEPVLGVSITAGPSDFTPFPYVVYEYFKLDSLTYIGNDQTFNPDFAFAYPGCTVNVHGYVGCVISWGGGTGDMHYYPGGFILIQDDRSPTQPWAHDFFLPGKRNATAWGDYDVAEPFQPSVGPFIATAWTVGRYLVEPHVVIWGRPRDSGGYTRWKAS
jgi:hypothetical protein